MKIYVFGNRDYAPDALAFDVVDKLQDSKLKIQDVEFVGVKPNQDLPFVGEDLVVILDIVQGITKVTLFTEEHIDKVTLPPRGSVHDFDLGFQLKYLRKLGKLSQVRIIGLPMGKEIDYSSIQSIFKKLVAQDIQGS